MLSGPPWPERRRLLRAAKAKRQRLLGRLERAGEGPLTYLRQVHAEQDGLPGLTLDQAGEVGILSLYRDLGAAAEAAWGELCAEVFGLRTLYLKRRPRSAAALDPGSRALAAPWQPLLGPERPRVVIREGPLALELRPAGELSVGLFSDLRPLRRWLRAHPVGRCLNTFAYTCASGVASALAGSGSVTNLDASGRALEWGRANFRLNGFPEPPGPLLAADVHRQLLRYRRESRLFDLIILDPPSFSRQQGKVWRVERDYPELIAKALALIPGGGFLVVSCNHHKLPAARLDQLVRLGLAAAGRTAELAARLRAGPDYGTSDHLKVLILQL